MASKKTKKRRPESATRLKGRLAERIAAWLHEEPGVKVETNVRLPSLRQNRRREIDVLLTLEAAGYPIRMAIECKNRGVVGAPELDAYIGKLQDVGIPPQLGIFISVGGFSTGAVDRARDAGVRTLLLEGLTPDGLGAALIAAVESTVYLIASMGQVIIENDLREPPTPWQHLNVFWDDQGRVCGTVPHLLWLHWVDGRTPEAIGTHTAELALPTGWQQVFNGHRVNIRRVATEIIVRGFVLSLTGRASRFVLRPPNGPGAGKVGLRFQFEDPRAPQRLRRFDTEDELAAFLRSTPGIQVTYRMKVPRIVFGPLYWPPTQASLARYSALLASGATPTLHDVEGPSISEAFRFPGTPSNEG
jgi:hypothetical protein